MLSSPSDDKVGALHGAIRARDVRAADRQAEPSKRVENRADFRHSRFVGFAEDGGSPSEHRKRAERAIDTASPGERSNQVAQSATSAEEI
jgi:hypothetical protein